MKDQAATLRRIMNRHSPGLATHAREIRGVRSSPFLGAQAWSSCFFSGKGGVGKSCLVANVGTWLARQGKRVLLVDADLGLANLDLILGTSISSPLEESLGGSQKLVDAVVGVEPNLWLLPSSSGMTSVDWASDEAALLARERLREGIAALPWEMDYVFVDAGSGLGDRINLFAHSSHERVVVVTPEPTSITDAYAAIKTVRNKTGVRQFSVIVNEVADGREANDVFKRLRDTSVRYLDAELDYLGHWEHDEAVNRSVRNRKILLDWDSNASSLPSLRLIGKRFELRTSQDGWVRLNEGKA